VPDKDTLLHTCFNQAFGDPLPQRCRCRKRLTSEEARHAVAKGEAAWLVVGYKEGHPLISTAQVVAAPKLLHVPRAAVCDAVHIARFVGMSAPEQAEEEAVRLQVIAELTFEFFKGLMIPWRPAFDERADCPTIRFIGGQG